MSKSMIERVADAIEEAVFSDEGRHNECFVGDRYGNELQIDGRVILDVIARAVIQAMREPTDVMLEAMKSVDLKGDNDPDELGEWQAAIDAALKEPTQ